MDPYRFLQKYQSLQYGVSYTEIIDLGFAAVAYSKYETSPIENYALVGAGLDTDQMAAVERVFAEHDRRPVVYFVHDDSHRVFRADLEQWGYAKSFEDAWMFYEGPVPDADRERFPSVRKVATETDLTVFLHTLDESFQKNDPQNPYGPITEFLQSAALAWRTYHADGRLNYFIAYDGAEPAATAILNCFNDIGYISAVGSKRSVRGKGFGKVVTLAVVDQSILFGNKLHCLSTEQGHYPYEFYRRIGFNDRFSALGYEKKG